MNNYLFFRKYLLIVSYAFFSLSVFSQDKINNTQPFINDICLPSTLYMLSDTQNDIFVEPLIKRWRPYNDVARFSGDAKYQRRMQRVASINNPINETTVEVELVNQDYFETIKTISSKILVGEKGKGREGIVISIIGDSFTNGAFFEDALLVKDYVPNLKMIGLRDVVGYNGQFDEGRGGWTLGKYFTVTKKRTDAYNGFWQPEGKFRYWGSTHFWKLANEIRINPDKDWSFGEKYNAGRYETQSLRFDEKTGIKIKPRKDDLMFDNDKDCFVQYDGENWVEAKYDDFSWSFDYGKYLEMWNLEAPSILAEFLGLNDFRHADDPAKIDFTKWNKQIEKLVDSYHKVVPDGKFVLMIPCSTCGILNNKDGRFTTKQNACMWEHRKNIIAKFDHREGENIYIVDAAIAIDNLNGYRFLNDSTYTKPYSEYTGKERISVQTVNPHPFENYPTMGISLAAFIQRYR